MTQVVHAALGEINVRLQCDAGRHGGVAHQFGVGRLLAADHHRRHAAADDGVDAVLPGPVAAEDPHDDEIHAVELLGELTVDEPGRDWPTDTARRSTRAVIRSVSDVDSNRMVGAGTHHSYRTTNQSPNRPCHVCGYGSPVAATSRTRTAPNAIKENIVVPSVRCYTHVQLREPYDEIGPR